MAKEMRKTFPEKQMRIRTKGIVKFKRTNVIVSCEREIRALRRSLVTVGKQVEQNDDEGGDRDGRSGWKGRGADTEGGCERRDNHSRLESDTDSGLHQV